MERYAGERRSILLTLLIHGDEGGFSEDIYRSLIERPIRGVDAVIGNPLAAEQGKRCIDVNMNFVGAGSPNSPLYDERRAHELYQLILRNDYDIVVDLHMSPSLNPTVMAGVNSGGVADRVASLFGVDTVILYPTDFFAFSSDRFVGVGIDVPKCGRMSVLGVRGRLVTLAKGLGQPLQLCRRYAFLGDVTTDEAREFGLNESVDSYTPLPKDAQVGLRVPSGTIMIGWGGTGPEQEERTGGIAGELAAPLSRYWYKNVNDAWGDPLYARRLDMQRTLRDKARARARAAGALAVVGA